MCQKIGEVVYKCIDKYVLDVKVFVCAALEIPESVGIKCTSGQYKKALRGYSSYK